MMPTPSLILFFVGTDSLTRVIQTAKIQGLTGPFREALKMAKFGNCSQIAGDPSTLAYLGILNCYFFIGYLGLLDHEMDFEINLFFSFTKVS